MNYIFEDFLYLNTNHVNALETSHLIEFVGVFKNTDLINVDLSSLDLSVK